MNFASAEEVHFPCSTDLRKAAENFKVARYIKRRQRCIARFSIQQNGNTITTEACDSVLTPLSILASLESISTYQYIQMRR